MRRIPSMALLGTNVVLWSATAYVVVRPLLAPRPHRGDFLWGHYAIHEVYVGVPLLLATLLATALLLCPRRHRLGFGRRVGAVAVSVALTVGLFDVGYSLAYAGAWRPDYWLDLAFVTRQHNVPDDELGFVRKPHVEWQGLVPGTDRAVDYRTDHNGFRNPEDLGQADVVFLGDSYTEAAQVDDGITFVRRVAERTGLSVANLGRGVYGPQQELIVLRRYGLELRPRFVVWQLFEGNDLSDAENFAIWQDQPDARRVSLADRYMTNSFFRRFIALTEQKKKGKFARLRLANGSEMPIEVNYRWRADYTQDRARGWRETQRVLSEGVALCREESLALVVVFVPVMARVNAERLSFADPADREVYLAGAADPQRGFAPALHRVCAELGCTLIDTTDALRRAAAEDPQGLFIPADEHFDGRGHELVADLIVEWIRAQ